jgi:hypothetical protein
MSRTERKTETPLGPRHPYARVDHNQVCLKRLKASPYDAAVSGGWAQLLDSSLIDSFYR